MLCEAPRGTSECSGAPGRCVQQWLQAAPPPVVPTSFPQIAGNQQPAGFWRESQDGPCQCGVQGEATTRLSKEDSGEPLVASSHVQISQKCCPFQLSQQYLAAAAAPNIWWPLLEKGKSLRVR